MAVAITCEHCGKIFFVKQSRARTARFCSQKCLVLAAAKGRGESICETCGKRFPNPRPGREGRFCSRECLYNSRDGVKRSEWQEKKTPPAEQLPAPAPKPVDDKVYEPKKRKCHDCGKLTTNYRCDKCWAKRGRTDMLSDNGYIW